MWLNTNLDIDYSLKIVELRRELKELIPRLKRDIIFLFYLSIQVGTVRS